MPRTVSPSCRTKSGARSRSKKCKKTGCYTEKITTCAPRHSSEGKFKSGKTTIYSRTKVDGLKGLKGPKRRSKTNGAKRSKRTGRFIKG